MADTENQDQPAPLTLARIQQLIKDTEENRFDPSVMSKKTHELYETARTAVDDSPHSSAGAKSTWHEFRNEYNADLLRLLADLKGA